MKLMSWTLSSPTVYHAGGKTGRWVLKHAPFAVNNKLNPWYKHRDMPEPPKQSFGEWYEKNRKQ
jgi:L-lactate dehydrogenase complex protein LldF